jgi:hypothetical protein
VFSRRRRQDADQGSQGNPDGEEGAWADPGDQGAWDDDLPDAEAAASPGDPGVGGGPWDASEAYPERERADFGSLLVPIVPTQQIELATDGQHFIWVTVKSGGSELRVHAFAAPRSDGLWEDVRQEIVAELASAGSATQETGGPFGPEIFAHVPVEPGAPGTGTRPVRFIGVDGPRWLLRGLIIGPAADGQEPAEPLEEILSDIVVVRGDHPMPPRDMLELRLPPEVQQALEQQAAAGQETGQEAGQAEQEAGDRFQTDLNPFERGPEFTETR